MAIVAMVFRISALSLLYRCRAGLKSLEATGKENVGGSGPSQGREKKDRRPLFFIVSTSKKGRHLLISFEKEKSPKFFFSLKSGRPLIMWEELPALPGPETGPG